MSDESKPTKGEKDPLREDKKGKGVRPRRFANVRFCDFLFPTLDKIDSDAVERDKKRVADALADAETRVSSLTPSPTAADGDSTDEKERLTRYLEDAKGLLEAERTRRNNIESRLSTLMGLSSVVAAVTFSALAMKASAGFAAPATRLAWLASLAVLYIVAQLVAAILAAVRGQSLIGETHIDHDELLPKTAEDDRTHLRRALKQYLTCAHEHQKNTNEKGNHLNVALAALRNFLIGVAALTLILTAANLFPSDKERDAIQALRSDPKLIELLRGRERTVDRTGVSASSRLGGAGRSADAFTNIVEVLERGRGSRGDRGVASERRVGAGVRAASPAAAQPNQVLGRAAVAS